MKESGLIIHVLDVGHGDSLLVEFPDGESFGIIDCHTHTSSNRFARKHGLPDHEPKVLSFLRKRQMEGVNVRVAFICLSHFHEDHFDGLATVVVELRKLGIKVDRFWDPGISKLKVQSMSTLNAHDGIKGQIQQLSRLYRELGTLARRGMELDFLQSQRDELLCLAGVKITLLAPWATHWARYQGFLKHSDPGSYSKTFPSSANENLVSSALLLSFGLSKVILAGDITNHAWRELLTRFSDTKKSINAVKISHHGSREGNFLPKRRGKPLESVVDRIGSSAGVIAAISGGYVSNLPHPDTLSDLTNQKARALCTGDHRSIKSGIDPIDETELPLEAKEHLKEISEPVFEANSSMHGDIKIKLYEDGICDVSSELGSPSD
jgi:beta-lactamase superfamily II metal-dependent hydrolase